MQGTKNDEQNTNQLLVSCPADSQKHFAQPALKLAFPGKA
jgi:hypothetical protein